MCDEDKFLHGWMNVWLGARTDEWMHDRMRDEYAINFLTKKKKIVNSF